VGDNFHVLYYKLFCVKRKMTFAGGGGSRSKAHRSYLGSIITLIRTIEQCSNLKAIKKIKVRILKIFNCEWSHRTKNRSDGLWTYSSPLLEMIVQCHIYIYLLASCYSYFSISRIKQKTKKHEYIWLINNFIWLAKVMKYQSNQLKIISDLFLE
jgi:hypothetical protein